VKQYLQGLTLFSFLISLRLTICLSAKCYTAAESDDVEEEPSSERTVDGHNHSSPMDQITTELVDGGEMGDLSFNHLSDQLEKDPLV